MTQDDAMNMSDRQALKILISMQAMMLDQHGCPISDAFFALGKAIEALKRSNQRCKNCMHHHTRGDGVQYCDNIDYGWMWENDDFCSKWRKKE